MCLPIIKRFRGDRFLKTVVAVAVLCFLSVPLFVTVAWAQSREVIQYTYDDAGNIVGIDRDTLQAPPTITAVAPTTLRIGPRAQVTLSGANLANARITTDDPHLIVGATRSTNDQVVFDLTANAGAAEGVHTLTATTALGSATALITVEPRLPELLIAPLPVVVAEGQSTPLRIELSAADINPQTFTLSVADPGIATLSPDTLTIPAGQKTSGAPITLSGIAKGTTRISVSAPAFGDFSLTVFVAADARLPTGLNHFYSPPLGVVLQAPPEPPAIITQGPFRSELGVVKGTDNPPVVNPFSPLVSPEVRVVKGSGITGISPLSLLADSGPVDLVIHGLGLGAVDSVAIVPGDDLLIGALTVAAAGDAVTVPVTVGADIALGQRRVVLSAAGEVVAPLSMDADRLYVGGRPPVIDSVDPITINRGAATTLTVRGKHFQQARSVSITPADDITIAGRPAVNDTGTALTVAIVIEPSALLGPRVVAVTTPTGVSSPVASTQNTLTITALAGTGVTPVTAAALGVTKGEAAPIARINTGYALPVGVNKGSVLQDLQPTAQATGSDFTLTLSGVGLQEVDAIEFVPDTGITPGAVTAGVAGDTVTVDVSIAGDAPTGIRRVRLSRNGAIIPVAIGGNDRFQVTTPQPVIDSVTPNFVLADSTPQMLTVRGQLFNNLQQLRIEPADDIAIDTPQVNDQGDTITVAVTADTGATTGPRVIVVETPGGTSEATPNPGNTLTLVGSIGAIFEAIVSPALGVTKEITPVPTVSENTVWSGLLGVEKSVTVAPVTNTLGLTARLTGVTLGPVATRALPVAASIDTSATLTIEGFELAGVTGVQLEPDTGITLGALAVGADQVSVPLTIAADAPQTLRRITINSDNGPIPFSDPARGRLRIAGPPATITSIEPIQQTPGANFTLLIRGTNLQTTQSVSMEPADNRISLGTPSVNDAGTELTLQVNLSETVTPGPRTVVVTTLAGSTSGIAQPANTFTVVDQ